MRKTTIIFLLLTLAVSGVSFAQGGGLPSLFNPPDSGYLSNVVIDIIDAGGIVMFATGEGLNISFDNGLTWDIIDSDDGLPSSSVSAMTQIPTAFGTRLWLATNHIEKVGDDNFNFSDGVSFSDDNGANWTQIDFSETGQDIEYVWGGDRTIFDITGHYDPANPAFDNWLFFASFAGGFLASRDGGMNWRRIYGSRTDSVQFNTTGSVPSLRNRYFGCVVDTSHSDTMTVWAGTAGGFFSYSFVEPKDKVYSDYINDMILCQGCAGSDSSFVYFAGDDGFSRGEFSGGPYITRFESAGLPSENITTVMIHLGRIFVGTVDPIGFAYSDDFGETFTEVSIAGLNDTIHDFTELNGYLFMAAGTAGMFTSSDLGASWLPDTLDLNNPATNGRNNVFGLEAVDDTLFIGTDSGLVINYYSPLLVLDSTHYYVFDNPTTQGPRVVDIKYIDYGISQVIWTINRQVNGSGIDMVGRSFDQGQTFTTFHSTVATHDIDFIGDSTLVVGDYGVRYHSFSSDPDSSLIPQNMAIEEKVNDVVVDSLGDDIVTNVEVLGDTVYLGTDNGFAMTFDRGENFNIVRVNQDSLFADQVLHYSSSINGINADWVPAVGVQYYDFPVIYNSETDTTLADKFAPVWISTRPTFSGEATISVGFPVAVVDSMDQFLGLTRFWGPVYEGFAWNFAFANDTVFAATNDGLLYASTDSLIYGSIEYDWETLTFTDPVSGEPLILPDIPVYAVEVSDDYIWVGTDDRTVVVNRSDFTDQASLYVLDQTTPADEVYAFPVPYSHVNSQTIEFHFSLASDADVTIEVYDFAMHLVKRVIDAEPFPAGTYPGVGSLRPTWDGRNGEGDEVAVGIYYFKIETSTGDVRWGKLAVIP